jgi:hypothetical protein
MEVWTTFNKHVVSAGHSPGPNRDETEVTIPAMYNPLLAYDRNVLDPGASQERDEGEARLRLLRPAIYMARKGHAGILDVEDDASLGALITSLMPVREEVHASLMKSDATWKPKLRLIAPTTRTFVAEAADAIPETFRVNCIPVKGSDRVCALNYPVDRLASPKLMLDFPKRHLNNQDAYMQVKRGKEPQTLELLIFSDKGSRHELTLTDVKACVIDRLMSPVPIVSVPRPLPERAGELPVDMQSAIADFWQRQMRCHVVATVCAPEDATRPLAFESITLSREGRGQPERLVLRATLHGSALKCACKLHGLAPMEQRFPSERFTSSEVDLVLSMCGRKRPHSAAGYGACPLHGEATPDVGDFPSICCQGTVASLGCSHFIAAGKSKRTSRRKSGLWIPDMALDGLNLLHAQGLMSAASQVAATLEPMLGKRPRSEICSTCEEAECEIEKTVNKINFKRAAEGSLRSDAEILTLDMAAVDALRANKVRRHVRPTTREEVLALEDENGKWAPVTKVDADRGKAPPLELAETHIGLFRPPLPRQRRA